MTALDWAPAQLARLAAQGAAAVGDAGRDGGPAAYGLRVATARAAVRWAVDVFGDAFTVASSMADQVLPHVARASDPGVDVFFIDTGLHFAQTLEIAAGFAGATPGGLRVMRPRITVADQEAEHGPRLWERDPDTCCALRKVEPLARALEGRAAWATGMRRADAAARATIEVVAWDARRALVKLNPLASWTDDDVRRYADEHDLPVNPLRELGYLSIGCAPCTRPVADGEDPRAGRWAGHEKTECGLHT